MSSKMRWYDYFWNVDKISLSVTTKYNSKEEEYSSSVQDNTREEINSDEIYLHTKEMQRVNINCLEEISKTKDIKNLIMQTRQERIIYRLFNIPIKTINRIQPQLINAGLMINQIKRLN